MSRVIEALSPWEPGGYCKRRYNWEAWTDGRVHVCTRGEDFSVRPLKFVAAAHSHAKRKGFRVFTRVRGDDVEVQFLRKGQPFRSVA
jgi:hypothetical protein